jgi:two-component system chemotaxis response regulator CheY
MMLSSTNGLWGPKMAEPSRKRVLVIDDAGLMRRYYREILESAGYEVDEALNGLEAMERLLQQDADLLIVDINMPQMDGLSFVSQLRQRPGAMAAIPALISSTEADVQDRSAAAAAGANFYLVKPVRSDVLLEHVALMCGLRHG